MAEKKNQDNLNPLPESSVTETMDKPKESKPEKAVPEMAGKVEKSAPAPTHKPISTPTHSPRFTMPSLTKTSPNDLYRKLLPAVLFVLTFVTVMTVLLIYMDTVALGAQQFRVNMSRDYELARIPQSSAPLVAYVRQLHLAPRPARAHPAPAHRPPQVAVLDSLYGEMYNGTFVEFLPRGGRSASTLYLEAARRWAGVCVRAAPRDYLALRAHARAAHACLSPTPHPREVSYPQEGAEAGAEAGGESVFRSRVLCLPLYTVLLAAEMETAQYVQLGGRAVLSALHHVPFHRVRLQVIEVHSTDLEYRNKTTAFLATKNYTVAAVFDESVMYALQDDST